MAVDDTVQVDEDFATALQILANDIDPDGGLDGAVVSAINGVGLAQDESVAFDLPSGATLLILPDSSFLAYTHDTPANALAAGEIGVDTFTYTLSSGNVSTTATVDVEIVGENDAPVVVNDTAFLVGAGLISVDVLPNDTDPDGDLIRLDRFLSVSRGSTSIETNRLRDFIQFTSDNYNLGISTIINIVTDASGAERNAVLTVTIVPEASIFGTKEDDAPLTDDSDANTIFALGGDGDDSIAGGVGRGTVFGGTSNDDLRGNRNAENLVPGVHAPFQGKHLLMAQEESCGNPQLQVSRRVDCLSSASTSC